MHSRELQHRLLTDLHNLKLPIDEVDIFFRPYSKTYYGRYFPSYEEEVKPKIYIYPYNEDDSIMSYEQILGTTIHELCHHIQYTKGFVRLKGVMHDTEFWKLYNFYTNRAKELKMFGGSVLEKAVSKT